MKAVYWFGLYLLLGVWLVISPYAVGFSDNSYAFWNAIGSGAFSIVLALLGTHAEREESADHHIAHGSTKTA